MMQRHSQPGGTGQAVGLQPGAGNEVGGADGLGLFQADLNFRRMLAEGVHGGAEQNLTTETAYVVREHLRYAAVVDDGGCAHQQRLDSGDTWLQDVQFPVVQLVGGDVILAAALAQGIEAAHLQRVGRNDQLAAMLHRDAVLGTEFGGCLIAGTAEPGLQ